VKPRPAAVIAVASGKGGTGKTTVAAHLALASSALHATLLVDLDVEAPDSMGYFPGAVPVGTAVPVTVAVPRLDESSCTACGHCASVCRFGAVVAIGSVVTVDAKACKGCGRCVSACPSGALSETEMETGKTSLHRRGRLEILEGRMAIGDIRSVSVIEAAKREEGRLPVVVRIRDCPPGVSCPATHAIDGADFVILVAEPTAFSLHDLDAAVRLVRGRGVPSGVVVNKAGFGDADIEGFCSDRGIPVIGRVEFNASRAASGAAGALWEDDPAFMAEMGRVLSVTLDGRAEREGETR